ncbi:class I SAM-dependent DNA methyltransferase [Xanthobacter sediminis]
MTALPHSASSGDPALDRRLDWARALLDEGDGPAAADLLADTVAAAPHFAAAWFLLGEAKEAAGDPAGAAEAFAQARACDADDVLGAGLRLARLGRAPAEGAMSAAYVRTLFDQYADRFDNALRDKLGYRGPELLLSALTQVAGANRRFRRALDLGCGTGLAAPLFAPLVEALDGVDLSPAMLARARALDLYSRLEAADMGEALAAEPAGGLDLILAADALCYLAALEPLFASAARALEPGGLFAFTVETHAGDGVLLRDTLRYAHPAATVRAAAAAAGLAVRLLEEASTRNEKGAPVPGLVAVLERA